MAKLPKRKKGSVPTIDEASNNLGTAKEVIKTVNFKVPISFVKEFKQFALDHDMSLTSLFKKSFHHYKTSVKK